MKIFLDPPLPSTTTFTVESEFWDYYLTTVKRLREGDSLQVAAGDVLADVEVVGTDPLRVKVKDTKPASTPNYQFHLVQAITRKKKFEETIKRGTELGVTEFTPVISEHTVREPNNPEKQLRRWKKISMDSARITGRDWMPTINMIQPFTELELPASSSVFFGDPEGESVNDAFASGEQSAVILVGPEGGFTQSERETLRTESAQPISLGNVNYRSETASMIFSVLWLNGAAEVPDPVENPAQNP
ncbi:MAG: 16S rRNA (uracil(1498)-N(3))-methyltransferase [bacterium]